MSKLTNVNDIKKAEKLIAELEKTMRHFRAGNIWNMCAEFRIKIADEADISL